MQPGAGAAPHIQLPSTQVAEPLGSLPQHRLELAPKQSGAVPVHVAASSWDASAGVESCPASQMTHAIPRGMHVHLPFKHRFAAYLLPQHPSQMTGAGPVHVAASSPDASELVASSREASVAVESDPASQMTHAIPRGTHVHFPFKHSFAAYLLPQHPSQITGAVPVHVAASSREASDFAASSKAASVAVESGPASQVPHDDPLGEHTHSPLRQSGEYVLPQHPLHKGGKAVHTVASEDASAAGFELVLMLELQAATRNTRRKEECRLRMGGLMRKTHALILLRPRQASQPDLRSTFVADDASVPRSSPPGGSRFQCSFWVGQT